jgi:hypothetical protein
MQQAFIGSQDAGWHHNTTTFDYRPIGNDELRTIGQVQANPVTLVQP